MAVPESQDFIAGLDATGRAAITEAELITLVSAALVYDDKGLVVTTPDVGGNPQVPDAVGTTKWQRYIWRRVTTTSVIMYFWNSTSSYDPTLLYWKPIAANSANQNNTSGILQTVYTSDITKINALTSLIATSAALPPTDADGTAIDGLETEITPISAASILEVEAVAFFGVAHEAAKYANIVLASFLNGGSNAVASGIANLTSQNANGVTMSPVRMLYRYQPGSVAKQTFTFRFMQLADNFTEGAKLYYNGELNTSQAYNFLGGTCPSFVKITEFGQA